MEWTSKDLREDYLKLKSLLINEKDNDKKEEIISAMHTVMYNICDIELGDDSVPEITDPMLLFMAVPKFMLYFPNVYKFKNTIANADYDETKEPNYISDKKDISFGEVFDLLHDFYKSTGKEIYETFLEIDKDRDKCIKFDEQLASCRAITYNVPILDKRYMVIGELGYNRDMLSTITHEYGHAITSLLNRKRYYSDDFFTEIESLFFEMIGADYYLNATKDKFFVDILRDYIYVQNKNAIDAVIYKRTSDATFRDMKDSFSADKLCHRHLRRKGIEDEEPKIAVDEKMKYLYSYMVAVELFEAYKEDKEHGIELFKKIICREPGVSEYNSIHDTVEPVKSMVKHIDRIKRYQNGLDY